MTLRHRLGRDAHRIHELVDQLLDGEDSLIVLMDGRRAVSYGEGFGLSPCQLELVTIEIERALRAVGGTAAIKSTERRSRSEQVELAIALAFLSVWVVMAVGMAAVWPTEEVRVVGLASPGAALDSGRTPRPLRTGQGSVGEGHASHEYNDVSDRPAVEAVGVASSRRHPIG